MITMRATTAYFLITFFAATAVLLTAGELPKTPSLSRYERLMNKSPFSVVTAAAPQGARPDFPKDFYISNVAILSDEVVVTLMSLPDRNVDEKEVLSTKRPNENGRQILKIEWSARPKSR